MSLAQRTTLINVAWLWHRLLPALVKTGIG
jgi:hypothetical protein